jgi:hypothetical protein
VAGGGDFGFWILDFGLPEEFRNNPKSKIQNRLHPTTDHQPRSYFFKY